MRCKLGLERGSKGAEQDVCGKLHEDAADSDGADFGGVWLRHGDKTAGHERGTE